MNLTDHFTLEEFTYSQTAGRLGIDNTVPSDLMANLMLTMNFMEQVRDLLGAPIIVTSGYRCPELNGKTPGSAKASAHQFALACDFISPRFGSPLAIASKIAASALRFDQLICEGTWVHVSPRSQTGEVRQQVMTAKFDTGHPVYSMGLHA